MMEGHAHAHADQRSATHETYRMTLATHPAPPRAGASTQIVSALTDPATGLAPKLTPTHEKLLHLIVVRRDLASFQHLHPELVSDGQLAVEAAFPTPGEYLFFADFTPAGREGQVARASMTIEGSTPPPAPLRPNASEPQVDGDVTATLRTAPAAVVAGNDAQLTFSLTDTSTGGPVADLRPYLGARGHAVILSADGQEYLHTHPLANHGGANNGGVPGARDHGHDFHHGHAGTAHGAASGEQSSQVTFHTRFPRPGLYKVWGQFDVGGRVRTFPFVLSVD